MALPKSSGVRARRRCRGCSRRSKNRRLRPDCCFHRRRSHGLARNCFAGPNTRRPAPSSSGEPNIRGAPSTTVKERNSSAARNRRVKETSSAAGCMTAVARRHDCRIPANGRGIRGSAAAGCRCVPTYWRGQRIPAGDRGTGCFAAAVQMNDCRPALRLKTAAGPQNPVNCRATVRAYPGYWHGQRPASNGRRLPTVDGPRNSSAAHEPDRCEWNSEERRSVRNWLGLGRDPWYCLALPRHANYFPQRGVPPGGR